MELRQLEYFVAVAEERSFTRAARRVHISQSGVSAQVRQLERELGAELIDRSTREATLTPAGVAALEPARSALAAVTSVRRAVSDVTGLVRGKLVVAMVAGCTVGPFFDALAAFHREHPGVEISVSEGTSALMVEHVRARTVDVALIGSAGAPPGDLESLPVADEGLVALVPPGHPLDARPGVSLSEVATYPLICLPPGTGIRTVFDQACVRQGLEPVVALEASAPDAVVDLARRGLGTAIVSASMGHDTGTTSIPLTGIPSRAVLALVWMASENPARRAFVRHCEAAFDCV